MNPSKLLRMATVRKSAGHVTIGVLPADGIGKEVVPATVKVLEALDSRKYRFINYPAGFELFQQTGTALPPDTATKIRTECDAALFGAVSSPSHKVAGYSSPIVALRKQMDLYANVRPIVARNVQVNGGKSPAQDVDMLIIRENTECLYVKQEQETRVDGGMRVATATRKISEYASRRIARVAFELALKRRSVSGRAQAKVTVVHKANVLSVTDGLFRECVLDEHKKDQRFRDNIQVEEQLVDSMVYRMYREPHLFDVAVAPNMYGDIISDAGAALVGSLGMVAGANVGDDFVIGEPVHGSAPDIYGRGISNPIACIRSAALMLEYLGELDDARRLSNAVDGYISGGGKLTPDMGGTAKTADITEGVIKYL
eukprot:Partr_v1_DN25298_c1_g1_i1_m16971 putative Dehydrogenase